jgi:hypothetical protein
LDQESIGYRLAARAPMGLNNRPFFDLQPLHVVVEEDRSARREDRQRFEESLDRYLELKEKLDEKIAYGQAITRDEEFEFDRLSGNVLKSVIVIGTWQLGDAEDQFFVE